LFRAITLRTHSPIKLAGIAGAGALILFLSIAPLRWAFAVLASTAVAILVLIRPAAGLLGIALLIPVSQLLSIPFGGITLVDLLIGLTLVAWLMSGVWHRQITLHPARLAWPLFVFVWVGALSLTQATSWREGVPEWLKWVEFALVYVLAIQLLDRRWRWYIMAGLFLAGVGQAILGAYQFLRQAGPEAFVLMGRFMRAYGTFRQPNPYAGYLGYLAPVAVSLSLDRLKLWWAVRVWRNLVVGLAYGCVAVALVGGIIMSWSQGAWLGLVAGLLVVVVLHSRWAAGLTCALITIVILVALLPGPGFLTSGRMLPPSIAGRLAELANYVSAPDLARSEITDENFSVLERLAHWAAGLNMFADHPWLGVGIGNYAVAYGRYALPHWYEPLGHAHNVYLNFLAETGILGTAAFASLWLASIWHALRQAGQADRARAALAIGLLGTLIYLTVHNVFDNLFVHHMQLQLALLLGMSERG